VKPTLRQTCLWPRPRAQFAFKDSMVHIICNSHYVSHFAAFFIVTGTKISVVESCLWLFGSCESCLRLQSRFALGAGLASAARRLPLARQPSAPARTTCFNKQGRAHSRPLPEERRAICGCSQKESPEWSDRFNDPSAGSPTETLLRLLLPLGGRV